MNITNNKNSGVRSAGSRSSHYVTHFGYNDILRDGILHPRKMVGQFHQSLGSLIFYETHLLYWKASYKMKLSISSSNAHGGFISYNTLIKLFYFFNTSSGFFSSLKHAWSIAFMRSLFLILFWMYWLYLCTKSLFDWG